MEILYRLLLIFSAILTCLFWGLPYSGFISPSSEEMSLLQKNGFGATLPGSDYIYWGGFLIWQLITIGLFFYSRVARISFSVFYVISFIATLFYGMQVLMAHEVFISSLLSLTDGALLVLIYFTSIGDRFGNDS